ncbi:MAG: hypothetical protein CL781_01465 [Chloroflexi bacterium]|nr:hypothetical protein [Chloroflexota bacterium]|tara:strand:- start:7201 stop:7635 length:435 start_codon:yes stop_codon:yes gene_type:complete
MVIGFNHSGFVVRDLDKMVSFYRDDLGLTIDREIDSKAPTEGDHTGIPGAHRTLIFVGTGGEHALELVYYVEPESPKGHLDRNQLGATHICFNVSDIEQLYEKLKAKGVKFVTPPVMKTNSDGSKRGICYCQDPEGNWLEFIQN